MAERVARSIKWSDEEWAVVVAAAGSMAPTTWVREAALAAARGRSLVVARQGESLVVGQVVRTVPAAPEERGSGRGGAGGAAAGDGGARGASGGPASSRSARTTGGGERFLAEALEGAPAAPNVGRLSGVGADEPRDLVAELKDSFDRVRRPGGSAGLAGSAVPPAAGRPAGAASSPSGAAPGAGSLQVVVVGLLTERFGRRADHPATALRMIREGRVLVYGDVVRAPGAPIAAGDDVRIV